VPNPSQDNADYQNEFVLGRPLRGDKCDLCPTDATNGCELGNVEDDGSDNLVDTCATLSWSDPSEGPSAATDQNPVKALIILKNLDKPAGEHGMTAKGFFNPVDPDDVDPTANGLHFRLAQEANQVMVPIYQFSIPPGEIGATEHHCGPKDGWKTIVRASGTLWKYANQSGKIPGQGSGGEPGGCNVEGSARGIFSIIIKDLRSKRGTHQYIVKSKNDPGTLARIFPVMQMTSSVTLGMSPGQGVTGSSFSMDGQCVESQFRGSGGGAVPETPRDGITKEKQAFCKRAPRANSGRPIKKIICRGL
jgi:hypothetical protein